MSNSWLNKTEYPFQSRFFEVNNTRMHYIDEGKGEVLLFVHGTPSWSFDFRNVIKILSKNYRCIAIDHIGFGLSDKPSQYDYSTQNHSRTLEKFIQAHSLSNITLVVHDFGGPIALNYAISHPGNISSIILLNTWLWSNTNDPEFQKLSKILRSPLLPFLYRYFNFSARFILPSSFGKAKPSSQVLTHYTKPFGSPSERNGTVEFAKSLLRDQDWFGELWSKREVIAIKPTLLIWGMKDRFLPEKYLVKFQQAFDHAIICQVSSAGHFPQEEEPKTVALAISNFLKVSNQHQSALPIS